MGFGGFPLVLGLSLVLGFVCLGFLGLSGFAFVWLVVGLVFGCAVSGSGLCGMGPRVVLIANCGFAGFVGLWCGCGCVLVYGF